MTDKDFIITAALMIAAHELTYLHRSPHNPNESWRREAREHYEALKTELLRRAREFGGPVREDEPDPASAAIEVAAREIIKKMMERSLSIEMKAPVKLILNND